MNSFWAGYNDGQAAADTDASIRKFNEGLRTGFRDLGKENDSLQIQAASLREDLHLAQSKSIVAEAAFFALKNCLSTLPESVQKMAQDAISQKFQQDFLARLARKQFDAEGIDMARVVTSWTPKLK